MMLSSRNSRSPFTAIQWQELENQALIYKYMVSGVPIPPDLLTAVRRSLVDSSLSSRLYPYHHQTIGWGCFEQQGMGRKTDPEPGRCRRTDGKKWRCPKEAYPGSRYCERHIHRGKSKAKKQLLEAAAASNNNSTNSSSSSSSTNTTRNAPTLSNFTAAQNQQQSNNQSSNSTFPFLCPNNNSSNTCSSAGTLLSSQFSPQNSSTHLLSLDSGLNNLTNKDFRFFSEMKESAGERSFFPQDSRIGASTYFPAAAAAAANINSSSSGGLSNLPFQGYRVDQTATMSKFKEQQEEQYCHDSQNQNYQQQQHHSYFLGIEAKSVRPIKVKQDFLQPIISTTINEPTADPNDNNRDQKQPLHHFFGEQWSRKNCDSSTAAADSWFDYENSSERSSHGSISTTTQLSMAIPMSSQDIPSPYSRFHSDS